MSFLRNIALSNEIKKLESIILYLRQKAMAGSNPYQLQFFPAKNSYSYKTKYGKTNLITLNKNIAFGFIEKSKGPPSSPKKTISSSVTFKNKSSHETATLSTDGKITPGTIYLIDTKKKYMQALTLPIGQISYIRRYRYQNNNWIPIEEHQ
jgi:hypothetical protein